MRLNHYRPLSSWPLLLLLLFPGKLVAQPSVYEIEPNNTPAEANQVSGEVMILGTMANNDQDGFMWSVSDVDARKRWAFELQGIPGALTLVDVFRVEFADNGVDVSGKEKLFTFGTRDGTRPARADNLLFEPGEYLMGVAYAGGGSSGDAVFRPPFERASFNDEEAGSADQDEAIGGYRLSIRQSGKLFMASKPPHNETRGTAHRLRLGSEHAAYYGAPESWFELPISSEDSTKRWDVLGNVPVGRRASVFLRRADGQELARTTANNRGQFSFPDLGLEAGTYYVQIQAKKGGTVRTIEPRSVGRRIEGAEAEPNDTWLLANRADLSRPVSGRAGKASENDYFRFSLTEKQAGQQLSLKLHTEPEIGMELCLLDANGRSLQCRSGKGSIELPDLVLTPGVWGFRAGRAPLGAEYSVELTQTGTIDPDIETEPNDKAEQATIVPTKNRIKGRFVGAETDFYRIVVTDEPQLWRFQVMGDNIHELAFHDISGIQSQSMRVPPGQRRARLDNVFLLPGQHHVRVTGRASGDYTLLARPIGPPNPDGEREPNDDVSRMQPLAFGQTRTGLLEDKADHDNYRFYLANWDHIRMTVEPPPDGALAANFYWDNTLIREWKGQPDPVVLQGLFPPGVYRLNLSAPTPSEAEYSVSLERLPRFGCPVDCEPNDNPAFANPLPPDLIVEGRSGEWRDWDYYALPVAEQTRQLAISTPERLDLRLIDSRQAASVVQWDPQAGEFHTTVPGGQQMYLRVGGRSEYRLQLRFDPGPAAAQRPPEGALTAALQTGVSEVAAYRRYGQIVRGRLTLQNSAKSARQVRLQAATSHHEWTVDLAHETIGIPANGEAQVELTIRVPADAWADRPVRISVGASDDLGARAEAFTEISAGRETRPVNPTRVWQLPDELVGGINVAAKALGGRRVPQASEKKEGEVPGVGTYFHQLFDGRAIAAQGAVLRGGHGVVPVTVELAGSEAVEVVGFAVHPLGRTNAPRFTKDLTFQLSADGHRFDTVLTGQLTPIKKEQAFVLEQPTKARFARLLLSTNFEGRTDGITGLGEWKVIARPGIDTTAGKGFNLADPTLGGHVVWSNPQIAHNWDASALTDKEDTSSIRLQAAENLDWVVGFHHSRAAQIERLEWIHPSKRSPEWKFPEVILAVSTDSPLGPWQPLGQWDLSASGSPQVFELDKPVWARYVKFSATGTDELANRWPPETLRIWERPTDTEYRSILAEWGYGSQEGIYEYSTALRLEQELEISGNNSRVAAQLLPLGRRVRGQVALGREEDWFGLVVPPGENTITVVLGGDPTVRTTAHLEDENGDRVPLREIESSAQALRLAAIVEPGGTYYLRVEEPPRNVLFLWDTSASVGAYLPIIYSSLMAYAEDVVPGRDACNFLPFGRTRPLLEDWYGEPYILQTVLNDYPRGESSSEAEETLAHASEALAGRPGTKAIVMVTDAATNRYRKVWNAFAEVHPQIFGLGLSSQGSFSRHPEREQDLMQDWSRVNGGFYSHLLDEGEMEVAFDRAATILRRPAHYTLEVTSEFRQAPGPGTLAVVQSRDGGSSSAGGAVELILDASGSMLKRMAGKRRIEIARNVLTQVVTEQIPAGTPLALRVFGHKEPNSCRTDLEIPLGPLEPSSAAAKIRAVDAKNLAKTPIADSLAKVAADLGQARGRKVVVLVTDGEETCEGDPEAVIRELRDKGLEVNLNIVGFAIDDVELERQFEGWAELGGGRYFSAKDQEGLSQALEAALQIPFSVFDRSGTQVAEGAVGGEPVELEAGFYRVTVATSPPKVFDNVEISGEDEVTLDVATVP